MPETATPFQHTITIDLPIGEDSYDQARKTAIGAALADILFAGRNLSARMTVNKLTVVLHTHVAPTPADEGALETIATSYARIFDRDAPARRHVLVALHTIVESPQVTAP